MVVGGGGLKLRVLEDELAEADVEADAEADAEEEADADAEVAVKREGPADGMIGATVKTGVVEVVVVARVR